LHVFHIILLHVFHIDHGKPAKKKIAGSSITFHEVRSRNGMRVPTESLLRLHHSSVAIGHLKKNIVCALRFIRESNAQDLFGPFFSKLLWPVIYHKRTARGRN